MNRNGRIWMGLVFTVALTFVLSSVWAFGAGKQKNGLAVELREEIKSYSEKKIHPELLEWKEMLDKSMSKEDLARLDELRAKAAAIREEMKKDKASLMAEGKDEGWDKDEIKDKMKDESKDYRNEMKGIMIELKPIAEKYSDVLKSIGEKAKPKRDEWENGILQIVNNWKNEHKEELDDMKGKRNFDADAFKKSAGLSKLDFDGDKKKKAAMFMLWDGKKPIGEDSGTRMNKSIKTAPSEGKAGIRSYPNPFNEKTTIYFSLGSQENVNLSIYDESGNKIAELFEGELAKGEHSFVFNTKTHKNLAAGTYTYKLTTATETKTGKMLFTK